MRLRVALRAARPVQPNVSTALHRLRRRFRRPSWYWSAAAVTVALTAGVVWQALSSAEHNAQRYGSTVTVAVATRSMPAGSELADDDLTMTVLPASMVPLGALRSRHSHATLRSDVVAGEVLLTSRVTGQPASPAAAQLRHHERGIAVPLPDAHLDLQRGDLVDLLAFTEQGTTAVISHRARVLSARDRTAVVAVDESDMAALGDALVADTVSLALIGA